MTIVIALDGPAGAGKSTVARLLAERLGLPHLDTGATYRLVAWQALRSNAPLDDTTQLADLAAKVSESCALGAVGLEFEGAPLGPEIRTPEVSEAASKVAANPAVRKVLVDMQRRLVEPHGGVVEGRDVGTVVLPDATLKVYLTAPAHERARRRALDLGAADLRKVQEDVRDRDLRDAAREVSPMRPATDAVVVDTSKLDADQVAQTVLGMLAERNRTAAGRRPKGLYRALYPPIYAILDKWFRLDIQGAERIPSGGAILAPNHRSLLDHPVVGALTRRQVWFLAKEELFSSRVGAAFITRLGAFPVSRGRADRAALKRAVGLLEAGELLCLYPAGTRTPEGRFDDLEDGLAYLALKSGAPVVPIAISGTQEVWPRDQRMPRRATIRVSVGEPFVLGGPQDIVRRAHLNEATAQATSRLRAALDALEPPDGGGS